VPSSSPALQAISTSAPESAALALRELRRADPALTVAATLAPGVSLLSLGVPFDRLAEILLAHPPIFVRHICPVDLEVALEGLTPPPGPAELTPPPDPTVVNLSPQPPPRSGEGEPGPAAGPPEDRHPSPLRGGAGGEVNQKPLSELLAPLREAALELAPRVDAGRSFSVQTRLLGEGEWEFGPFDVNQALAEAVREATGAPLDVRQPAQVLSVVCVPGTGYVGLSDVEQNLSSWAGGARRFAREPGQISRSEFKLLEALEVFALPMAEGGLALDLGAAPGGWTHLLRARGLRVVAVDPGDLDPRLAGDRGIRHVRATAQQFLPCRERFDLIVNDMRMDARDSARVMLDAAPCLRPNGHALMTLKLPAEAPEQVMHQALALLGRRYHILGARQLFHNRSEVTVALAPGTAARPGRGDWVFRRG
jgi:23S rRNA (cytidine2498-2'-O)-methyltransferase